MMDYSAEQLFELLNQTDECDWIEAKSGSKISRPVMETVCAYSNEPGLNGGYILLGVREDFSELFPRYVTSGISDPDKLQSDLASQCASRFNIPVRPKVEVQKINSDTVISIYVKELSPTEKPLYFKSEGLPKGAFRRIGPTDQRCSEDDMQLFYSDYKSYDQTPLKNTSLSDVDESALKRYRVLRSKVNEAAEELNYDDSELLEALGCVNKDDKSELNLAGLMLFGSSKAIRSHFPMMRVDYIRVPGNQWVEDPDDRFTTIDMRGPLLLLLYRLIDAINADLPKGFLLQEDSVQASSIGLPLKALREAIVNALIHRSYREHRPIQVIRYNNRIEIINPGYSLKAEELLGEPGSETRNPFIASVFHETNLAETKGSGIRAMRRMMESAQLAPPTFESDRSGNQFVSRLLLHHFLNEVDLEWLEGFQEFSLSNSQKQALIFVREVGAIDNRTYRQMVDLDVLKASMELRYLKTCNLLHSKGKGRATYYIAGDTLSTPPRELSTPPRELSTPPRELSTPPRELSTPPRELSTPPRERISEGLKRKIASLGKRVNDKELVKEVILEICRKEYFSSTEIALLLGKREDYVKRRYLSTMIKNKELIYRYPEMMNHPEQAYKANH